MSDRKLSRMFSRWRCDHPPVKTLSALIEAATMNDADILTDPSWNLDYGVQFTLTVREIRVLAEFVEAIKDTTKK